MTGFSDNMTRLRIHAPADFHWKPRQHVYLRIPALNIFDNHPFTIANGHHAGKGDDEYNELNLLIRSYAGFTRRLRKYVSTNPDSQINGWLDGPYGGHHRDIATTFDSVILVAGGSGVSAVLPWLDHLVTRMKSNQTVKTISVKLLWSIRRTESWQWVQEILDDMDLKGLGGRVRVAVHITGEDSRGITESKELVARPESVVTDQSASPVISHGNFGIDYGRINLEGIFDDLPSGSRSVIIGEHQQFCKMFQGFLLTLHAGCGPESLKVDLSNVCAKSQRLVMKGQLTEVELRTETFGW